MEENIGEQPLKSEENVQEGTVIDGTAYPQDNGSLGKFKDTESMLNAYNNLQAEFTRKCQKLSEANQKLEELKKTEEQRQKDDIPIYEKEDWESVANDFLSKFERAKEYKKEIADEIYKDPNLAVSPFALELAWGRVMEKNFNSADKFVEDENFLNEKILSNSQIKERVLNEYFKGLQNIKNPPVISRSGNTLTGINESPKNMAEAKKMVEELFKLKGN